MCWLGLHAKRMDEELAFCAVVIVGFLLGTGIKIIPHEK
jgi:hypothetical protein